MIGFDDDEDEDPGEVDCDEEPICRNCGQPMITDLMGRVVQDNHPCEWNSLVEGSRRFCEPIFEDPGFEP